MKHQKPTQASVTIGGIRYELCPGKKQLGALTAEFFCRQPEEGFYDWTVTLKNTGNETSERITELYGLSLFLPLPAGEGFIVNGLRGDNCSPDSYTPESTALSVGNVLEREPSGGRSSDTTAFPYFDFSFSGHSIVFGIGWSGQWKMTVSRAAEGVSVKIGQRDCDTVLYPGETIRSVRMLLWAGETDTLHARQKFVACHRKYASPYVLHGADYDKLICTQAFDRYFWSAKAEPGKAPYFETEEAQIRICEAAGKCDFIKTHWVDACWFRDTFRSGVGNYSEYSVGFPRSLRPVSEAAHQNGMQLIVWFEPVRAMPGTEAWNRFAGNPKQLVRLPDCSYALLNLGDDEVWEWIYSRIVSVMEESGIDCFREDFNLSPLDFLLTLEEEGRFGMVQMRFVEGVYRLWDALREHFPGLVIDDCSSGGRLLDAETCSRAFSLWQSDTACRASVDGFPTAMIQQNQNLALSRYIPHHQGSSFTMDAYSVRSAATYGIACEFPFIEDDFDTETAKAALAEVSMMSRYWKGDFTPLTEFSKDTGVFSAYALTLSEKEGMIAVFRRPDTPGSCYTVQLSGMDKDAEYRITRIDEDRNRTMETIRGSGFDALPVFIEKAPASMLILWEKLDR